MKAIELETALKTIGTIFDRNLQYISFDLMRGMFASISEELAKGAKDEPDTGTDTAAK
jgi:hypothetical protein